MNDDDTKSIPEIFISIGFVTFLSLMFFWPFTFLMEIVSVFKCLHDKVVNTRKKNKEYIIQSTTWGYYYIIDYLHTGNYCLFDDIEAKEWRLTQVIKSFNGKLRNRVIWSMM